MTLVLTVLAGWTLLAVVALAVLLGCSGLATGGAARPRVRRRAVRRRSGARGRPARSQGDDVRATTASPGAAHADGRARAPQRVRRPGAGRRTPRGVAHGHPGRPPALRPVLAAVASSVGA